MGLEAIGPYLARLKPDSFNKLYWVLGLVTALAFALSASTAGRARVATGVERHGFWLRAFLIAAAAAVAAIAVIGSFRSPFVSAEATAVTLLGLACVALLAGFCRWVSRAPVREVALVAALLAVAAGARLGGTALTREADRHIDLTIYVSGGRLLSAGVNPYDWQNGVVVREQLRMRPGSYEPWVSESQERWDHYASSNLPLTLLFFGLADRFGSEALPYRILFALCDCALAGLIGLFVLRHWFGGREHGRALGLAMLLGALSPVLLHWGTRQPEDKGLQILLMLGVLHAARAPNSRMLLAAVLLASSVAFKALGIFVAPLAAIWMWQARGDRGFGPRLGRAAAFAGLAALAGLVMFAPFLPEVVGKASDRLSTHVGAPIPIHGSPFALIATLWPGAWSLAQRLTMVALIAMLVVGRVSRRLSWEVVTAGALVLFVAVALTTGSLDRLNMAFLPAVLLVGAVSSRWGGRLAWVSFLAYLPVVVIGISTERYDQLYALIVLSGFVVAVAAMLARGERHDAKRETERAAEGPPAPAAAAPRHALIGAEPS